MSCPITRVVQWKLGDCYGYHAECSFGGACGKCPPTGAQIVAEGEVGPYWDGDIIVTNCKGGHWQHLFRVDGMDLKVTPYRPIEPEAVDEVVAIVRQKLQRT